MSELLQLHIHFPSFEKGCASPGLILCLCGAFPASPLWRFSLSFLFTPDGTSFNIQNPIPHPSQKEKVLLETRRAKECQRGIAGAADRAKEGDRVLFESSDTRLGSRGRAFESLHSDQKPSGVKSPEGFVYCGANFEKLCLTSICSYISNHLGI